MKRFSVQVTETINHCYLIEAEDADEAVEKYYNLSSDELKTLDRDGEIFWDKPWDVEEQDGED